MITVPNTASEGQYIFKAQVFKDDESYGNIQKFYVTVK